MRPSIPRKVREQVAERAAHTCEYCRISQEDAFFPHEVDHIISLKHAGNHHPDNFALACFTCNRNKGSDIGTMLLPNDEFVRFFNPRTDRWGAHFLVDGPKFVALTLVAEATIKIFGLNHPDRIMERQELMKMGRWG